MGARGPALSLLLLACGGGAQLEIDEADRACTEDPECALVIGCGGCVVEAAHVDHAADYEPTCRGRYDQCARRSAEPEVDKWPCGYEPACVQERCEAVCPGGDSGG